MTLPVEEMLRDAANVQAMLDRGTETFVGRSAEVIGDECCHVQALVAELDLLNRVLNELQAHLMHDYGATCDIYTMMKIIEKGRG